MASRFASFHRYKQKLGLRGLLLFFIRRMTTPAGEPFFVKVRKGPGVFLRNGTCDVRVFSQIFVYDDLNFALPSAPATIVDCGANIGLATAYLKQRYPAATVVCVEPEASNFAMLQRNTRQFQNVHLLKSGIWSRDGVLYLVDNGGGHDAFTVSDQRPDGPVVAEIEVTGIGQLMQTFGLKKIDLLKMDIEGSEHECFARNSEDWTSKTACIAVEIHESMRPGTKALIDGRLQGWAVSRSGEYHVYQQNAAPCSVS